MYFLLIRLLSILLFGKWYGLVEKNRIEIEEENGQVI